MSHLHSPLRLHSRNCVSPPTPIFFGGKLGMSLYGNLHSRSSWKATKSLYRRYTSELNLLLVTQYSTCLMKRPFFSGTISTPIVSMTVLLRADPLSSHAQFLHTITSRLVLNRERSFAKERKRISKTGKKRTSPTRLLRVNLSYRISWALDTVHVKTTVRVCPSFVPPFFEKMFRLTSQFDKLLDKATSNLRLEPDWPTIIQICDLIRQGDVQPKYAVSAIKKKLSSGNPHVAMFSLQVLESCVKNCGSLIHEEVGTKSYMEHLREMVKTTTHENVKNKVLELLQTWAFAFRNSPKYRAVQDTVNIMKAEGYKFPTLKESDAMFSADTAPEWADGECCHRCRVQFGMVQRKHHCRACGQVFCGQCSSKSCTLPKFGIEREVRVCEACYEKVNKPTAATKSEDLPVEYLTSSLAQQSQAPPPRKSDAELREEEELQLAIALSQSEAEQKTKIHTSSPMSSAARAKTHSPPPVVNNSPENDPELARYLNRSYWQQQSAEHNSPSAPASATTSKQSSVPLQQNGVEEEMDDFVHALQSQVEIFVNRMKSNSSRGRSIANDSSVQTLFMTITAMHSKLLRYIQQQDDSRVYYEGLQDRLTQVKDARAALDALREEHKEKLRREAELAERQRQMQMAQKLDIMRKKKQEYLQYQRQLALQRIQEQEREMVMRQEQQKQQYLMGSYANIHYMPPGYDSTGRYPPAPMPPASGFPPYQPGAPLPPSGPPVMGMSPEYMGTLPRGMMGGSGGPPPGGPPPQPQPPMVLMGPPPSQMMGHNPPMAPPMGQVMSPPMPPPQTAPIPMPQMGSPTISAPQMAPPPPQQMMLPPQQQPPQPQPLPQPQQPKEEETAELISFD